MSGEQKPSDLKRHLYIDEAMAYAYKHNEWCAPCVWWVCDHSGNEKGRHILALFDALTAAQAAVVDAQEKARTAEAKLAALEAERDALKAKLSVVNGICDGEIAEANQQREHAEALSSQLAALQAVVEAAEKACNTEDLMRDMEKLYEALAEFRRGEGRGR